LSRFVVPRVSIRGEESEIANGAAAKVREEKEKNKERRKKEGRRCVSRPITPIRLARLSRAMSDDMTSTDATHSRHVHWRDLNLCAHHAHARIHVSPPE
jgi:predicted secreted protein